MPEIARTAGRSGRAGAFTTPALSPAFFHTGPAPRPRQRRSPTFLPKAGQTCPGSLLGEEPYPALQAATQRLTGANSEDTAGTVFFFVLRVSF